MSSRSRWALRVGCAVLLLGGAQQARGAVTVYAGGPILIMDEPGNLPVLETAAGGEWLYCAPGMTLCAP